MVRTNASWVMVTWDPLLREQTDTTENITFPQLRWRGEIIGKGIIQFLIAWKLQVKEEGDQVLGETSRG